MRVPAALLLLSVPAFAAAPKDLTTFLEQHCVECHDADLKKGGLDLTARNFDVQDPRLFEKWVKIHDIVADSLKQDGGLKAFVTELVLSETFRRK